MIDILSPPESLHLFRFWYHVNDKMKLPLAGTSSGLRKGLIMPTVSSWTTIMATPQLASFKVPAIDNEPMVSWAVFFFSPRDSSWHSSEILCTGLCRTSCFGCYYRPNGTRAPIWGALYYKRFRGVRSFFLLLVLLILSSLSPLPLLGQDRQNRQTTFTSWSRTLPLCLSRSRWGYRCQSNRWCARCKREMGKLTLERSCCYFPQGCRSC